MTDVGIPEPGEGPIVRRVVAVAGTRSVLLVFAAVSTVLVARHLGPAGRGQFAVVVSVAVTAGSLAHLSIEQAQVYLVGGGLVARRLAANAVVIGAGLGCLAVVAVLTVAQVSGYPFDRPFAEPAFLLAMAAVPPMVIVLFTNGLLVLEGRTDILNRAQLVAGVTQCLVLVGLVVTDRLTVVTAVLAWLPSMVLPLLTSLPFLRPRRTDLSAALARRELAIGARYHGGMASLYLLLRLDVLLLAALSGDADVGRYALAVSLVELTNVATDAVATVLVKRQVELDLARSALVTARVVGTSVLLAACLVGAVVLTGPLLIPRLFGEGFRPAQAALVALAPGVLALAGMRGAGSYLVRLNRPWVITCLAASAMVVNVVLNLVLIPPLGIVGAGLASSVAYVLLACSYLVWFVRAAGVRPADFAPRPGLGAAA